MLNNAQRGKTLGTYRHVSRLMAEALSNVYVTALGPNVSLVTGSAARIIYLQPHALRRDPCAHPLAFFYNASVEHRMCRMICYDGKYLEPHILACILQRALIGAERNGCRAGGAGFYSARQTRHHINPPGEAINLRRPSAPIHDNLWGPELQRSSIRMRHGTGSVALSPYN